ncbi:MAG: TetR/AcrR family transcriptional regulator [Burkholderiales bacterium]
MRKRSRPSRSKATKRARSANAKYHHGNLPAALVEVAKVLIAERGLEGFTLREVARRIGVTHVAAYRHFTDRSELLAAVAEHGFLRLGQRLEHARKMSPELLEPRIRAILAAYVHFCWEEPALVAVMFGPRLSPRGEYPHLEAAVERGATVLAGTIAALAPPRALLNHSARNLSIALWTFVHGFSTLSYNKGAYPSARMTARAFDAALTPMLAGMFGGKSRSTAVAV